MLLQSHLGFIEAGGKVVGWKQTSKPITVGFMGLDYIHPWFMRAALCRVTQTSQFP